MFKSDTALGIFALIIVCAMAAAAAYLKVDIDAGTILMTAVTAIAALIRGDRGTERKTDRKDEPKEVG
jgi:uncharacterized membrane protein